MFAMEPVVEITGPCSYCDVAGRLRFENITEEVLLKTIIKGVLGVWRDIAVCHARHCTGQYTAKCANTGMRSGLRRSTPASSSTTEETPVTRLGPARMATMLPD